MISSFCHWICVQCLPRLFSALSQLSLTAGAKPRSQPEVKAQGFLSSFPEHVQHSTHALLDSHEYVGAFQSPYVHLTPFFTFKFFGQPVVCPTCDLFTTSDSYKINQLLIVFDKGFSLDKLRGGYRQVCKQILPGNHQPGQIMTVFWK